MHVYAAVTTMISLTLLHACMCYGQLKLGPHQAELTRSKLASARPVHGIKAKAVSIDWQLSRSDEAERDVEQTNLAHWTQYQRSLRCTRCWTGSTSCVWPCSSSRGG